MVYYWAHPHLGHMAEKSLEHKIAPWGSGRLHRLVLERTVDLAKSTPERSIRCRYKSCMFNSDLLYIEIFVERGI